MGHYYTMSSGGSSIDIQRDTGDGRGKFVARCNTSEEANNIINALELKDAMQLVWIVLQGK